MFERTAYEYALKIAKQVNENYTFNNIILDRWRGKDQIDDSESPRLIYDSWASRNCNNDCTNCPHYKILGIQGPKNRLPVEHSLFKFDFKVSEKDFKLYGPEQFLSCKSLVRYTQCFINCILYDDDMREYNLLRNELILISNFSVIWTTESDGTKSVEIKSKKKILQSVLESDATDIQHKNNINDILRKLDWNFEKSIFQE